jgi:hypothetical protein
MCEAQKDGPAVGELAYKGDKWPFERALVVLALPDHETRGRDWESL